MELSEKWIYQTFGFIRNMDTTVAGPAPMDEPRVWEGNGLASYFTSPASIFARSRYFSMSTWIEAPYWGYSSTISW